MSARRGSPRRSGWSVREVWPLAVLVIAVLVPMALLSWFMSDAITNQALASRQTAFEAYRSHLRVIRTRTDSLWQPLAQRLNITQGGRAGSAASRFADLVQRDGLDAAVVLNANGRVVFPPLVSSERSTSADRQLLAMQRFSPNAPAGAGQSAQLAAMLNDYNTPVPAAQRLFLMAELRQLSSIPLPTENALRLSMQLVESSEATPEPGGFRPTSRSDVWALTSSDRRVVGFYRTTTVESLVNGTFAEMAPPGIRFVAYPPNAPGDQEAVAVGPALPGWQMSFVAPNLAELEAAGRARLLTYLWSGFAGLALVALSGVMLGHILRRQLRLEHLKTDLTAAVSHELRAPLASVRVLVDGLLADRELQPVKTREYLELIAGEHARLSRIIENFLTFARLERSQARFALVPTQPGSLVEAAIAAVRERTPANCDLRVIVADDLPEIMADSEALGTALVNLLDNAFKFTPPEKHIVVRAYQEDDSVMLTVRDNGIGIPVREQRRIFKRFYRVDQRLARETAGVGLGLSIVALIVRAHGGKVDVASEPGSGSTFSLRVPALVTRPAA